MSFFFFLPSARARKSPPTSTKLNKKKPNSYRQAEEPRPQPPLRALDQPRLGLDHRREEVAVAVLVLAPVLEVLEERVGHQARVALQVAVDRDVAPVADLLGEVGRVDDVLGLFGVAGVNFLRGEKGRER